MVDTQSGTGVGSAGQVTQGYRIATYILLWLFAPVGIWLLWKRPVTTPSVRKILTAASIGLFLVATIATAIGESKSDTSDKTVASAPEKGCTKDTDCKGDRVCKVGACVAELKSVTANADVVIDASPTAEFAVADASVSSQTFVPGYYIVSEVAVTVKPNRLSGEAWNNASGKPDPEVFIRLGETEKSIASCKKQKTLTNVCSPGTILQLDKNATIEVVVLDSGASPATDPTTMTTKSFNAKYIGRAKISAPANPKTLGRPVPMKVQHGQIETATITLAGVSPKQVEAWKKTPEQVKARKKAEAERRKLEAQVLLDSVCGDGEATFRNGILKVVLPPKEASSLKQVTIDGHTTIAKCAENFDKLPKMKSVTVVEFAEVPNRRGHVKKSKIAEFRLSRRTAKKISWDNVKWKNIPKIIDKAWMKPGVAYLVD